MKKKIGILTALLLLSIQLNHLYGQELLLPEIPDWKISVSSQVYDPNNLWDIIDGAADLYLEYAFSDLHIARYINRDSLEVKAELYRHKTPLDAFGIYSQERDPDYNFIRIGAQGYLQQGVLNFISGIYYIKLSTFTEGEKGDGALLKIARRIEEHLKQVNNLPEILQLFPAEGRLVNTEQYVAQNFLGYSFLKSAATVKYKFTDTEPFKAFIIDAESGEQSRAVLDKYLKGIPRKDILIAGNNSYEIADPNNGIITVAQNRKYLFGVINCGNGTVKTKIMNELSENLSRSD